MSARRRRAVGRTLVVIAALGAAPGPARAQEEDDDAKPGPAEPAEPEPAADAAKDAGAKDAKAKDGEAKDGKPKEAKPRPPIEVTGRVFARAEAFTEAGGDWLGELGLASARIGVRYRWKDRVRARVNVELARNPRLRDAYVQVAASHGVAVRAGRFKIPVSVIQGESMWNLPTIDRGVVSDILEDGIVVTGRRDAVGLDWRGAGPLAPRVELAAAQSEILSGIDVPRPLADGAGIALAGRFSLEPMPVLEVGASGSWRAVDYQPGFFARYWSAGVDAALDVDPTPARCWGVRLWADAIVGTSHLDPADPITTFFAAQVIGGFRWGGADRGKRYVEPYASLGVFDPELGAGDDTVRELVGGVAAGRWKRWRVQAQLAYRNSDAGSLPVLGFETAAPDRTAVQVQLGASF